MQAEAAFLRELAASQAHLRALTGSGPNAIYGVSGFPESGRRPLPERELSTNERLMQAIAILMRRPLNVHESRGGDDQGMVRFIEGETNISRSFSASEHVRFFAAHASEGDRVFGLFSLDDMTTPLALSVASQPLQDLIRSGERLVVLSSEGLTDQLRETVRTNRALAPFHAEQSANIIMSMITHAASDIASQLQSVAEGETPDTPRSVLTIRSDIDHVLSSLNYDARTLVFNRLSERLGGEAARTVMGSFSPVLDENLTPIARPNIRSTIRAAP